MAFKWTPNFCWQWIRRQICTNCFSGHSMTHKHKISLMALNTIQELYHRKVSQKLYTWSYYNYGRNYSAHHIERQNNFESLHAYHFTRPWQPINFELSTRGLVMNTTWQQYSTHPNSNMPILHWWCNFIYLL